jgi:hypothetical protein
MQQPRITAADVERFVDILTGGTAKISDAVLGAPAWRIETAEDRWARLGW